MKRTSSEINIENCTKKKCREINLFEYNNYSNLMLEKEKKSITSIEFCNVKYNIQNNIGIFDFHKGIDRKLVTVLRCLIWLEQKIKEHKDNSCDFIPLTDEIIVPHFLLNYKKKTKIDWQNFCHIRKKTTTTNKIIIFTNECNYIYWLKLFNQYNFLKLDLNNYLKVYNETDDDDYSYLSKKEPCIIIYSNSFTSNNELFFEKIKQKNCFSAIPIVFAKQIILIETYNIDIIFIDNISFSGVNNNFFFNKNNCFNNFFINNFFNIVGLSNFIWFIDYDHFFIEELKNIKYSDIFFRNIFFNIFLKIFDDQSDLIFKKFFNSLNNIFIFPDIFIKHFPNEEIIKNISKISWFYASNINIDKIQEFFKIDKNFISIFLTKSLNERSEITNSEVNYEIENFFTDSFFYKNYKNISINCNNFFCSSFANIDYSWVNSKNIFDYRSNLIEMKSGKSNGILTRNKKKSIISNVETDLYSRLTNFFKNINEITDCEICYDMKKIFFTPCCLHKICFSCFSNLIEHFCPFCKQKSTKCKIINNLFLSKEKYITEYETAFKNCLYKYCLTGKNLYIYMNGIFDFKKFLQKFEEQHKTNKIFNINEIDSWKECIQNDNINSCFIDASFVHYYDLDIDIFDRLIFLIPLDSKSINYFLRKIDKKFFTLIFFF